MLPSYRVRQRDYLLEISRALTEELNLDALLNRILSIAIDMLSGQAGFIALKDESSHWHLKVAQGIPGALTQYLNHWVQTIPSSEDAPNLLPEVNRFLSDVSMGSMSGIGLPLMVHEDNIGEIYILRRSELLYTPDDHAILRSFADQAAIAVRNAWLFNQTIEQALRLSAILNTVVEGILILDAKMKVIRINTSLVRLLNQDQKDMVGKSFNQVIRWAKAPKGVSLEESLRTYWSKYTQDQLFLEGDLLRSGDLKPLAISLSYAPLFDHEGHLINIICSIKDISRFREADELKSNFISVVSHELKTPIALIKGYASTLRRDDVKWDPGMVQESLRVIEDEADHLSLMVEDLLDASRLQASGGIGLKKADLDLPVLAKEVTDRFAKQDTEHSFSTEFPPNFPEIIADENRLRQVLTNLVGNAVKYSQSGKISISGSFNNQTVTISVSDQGKGFDPADLPFVFDRFYRSEDAIKTSKGTGLGLYLVKAIIKAHDGRLWVDTNYKEGARISFELPRFGTDTPLLRLEK